MGPGNELTRSQFELAADEHVRPSAVSNHGVVPAICENLGEFHVCPGDRPRGPELDVAQPMDTCTLLAQLAR